MTEISATIRLRPARIGFLVRPTDTVSIRRIMRSCACIWGGIYNPIIPVFRTAPKNWKPEPSEHVRGLSVAKGYISFFEPDVFVEAEEGLLEEIGLGVLRDKHGFENHIRTLQEFLTPREGRDWSEPAFGLNITDVFRHLYETEQRFQMRKKTSSVLIKADRTSGLVEAIFGSYPQQREVSYIPENYKKVFDPKEIEATPESWLEVFERGARTPLGVTRHGIERQRYWHHDLLIYIFDPAKPTDLVDLWNLRLEPRPVLPVPINWILDLLVYLQKVIKSEHRPVRGNPNGIMHHTTVEMGRSISEDRANDVVEPLRKGLPAGALAVKHWRNRIWKEHTNDWMHRDRRMEIVATEQRTSLSLGQGRELTVEFDTLAPDFASRFGAPDSRWVNAVRLSTYGPERFATVLPFNIFDRRWPRLVLGSEWTTVTSEGWIFSQKYKGWSSTIRLLTSEEAIAGHLNSFGITATLSDPGHIAKQMLDHLGRLWDVRLLADLDTLQLLNKMAGGVRRKVNESDTFEENFERRSAPVKAWTTLLAQRKERQSFHNISLSDFAERNVIRVGLETDCPHCKATNWHSLTTADYRLTCERCLNVYDFPQAQLRDYNGNWHYRVVGPFSVPDFGRGSYSALLALRVFGSLSGLRDEITFSTAMNLRFDGLSVEVDFVALHREERLDQHDAPKLLIGETKSLGQGDLIKSKDLAKLRATGRKLPGAFIVVSVLRKDFTAREKRLLRSFVRWGRRPDNQGRPRNPVILLTGHELFMEDHISHTWKELGEPHSTFSAYDHTSNLYRFADATQRIYLDLPPIHKQRDEERKKRKARARRN